MKSITNVIAFLLGVATLFALVSGAFIFVPSLKRLTKSRLLTADEVLATIDRSGYGYYPYADQIVSLPATELEKVARELRSRHPLVSIADRLQYEPRSESAQVVLTPESRELLSRLDKLAFSRDSQARVESLKQLHSSEVESFINREGFGFGRRPIVVSQGPKTLKVKDLQPTRYSGPVKKQPSHFFGNLIELEPGAELSNNGMPETELISSFHERGLQNFAVANRNGFVKDLDNVAGFQPHQLLMPGWNGSILKYRQRKDSDIDWVVNRINLISLMAHDTPRVYVSDELPTMQSAEQRETRPLNEFEKSGLESFENGQTVYYSAKPNRIELIGAIRAGAHCLECHQGQRGKVLGAFTYEILRTPQVDREMLDPKQF